MEILVSFADLTMSISGISEKACHMLSSYKIDSCSKNKEILSIVLKQEDVDFEIRKTRDFKEKIGQNRLPDNLERRYCEPSAICRKISDVLPRYNGLLMHGSCLAMDGEAVIFIAPSGTGKSTHSRMWREVFGEHVVMVNDDKPFIRFSSKGIPIVYGSCWSGKHRLANNIGAPLKAVCVLEQGDENYIDKMTIQEMMPYLFRQSHKPARSEMLKKTLDLNEEIARCTDLYKLKCKPDHNAAQIAYTQIFGGD